MHGMAGLSLTLACALTPVCCGFSTPQIGYKLLVPTRLAYSPGTEHHVSHGKIVPDHPVTAGEWRGSDRLTSRLKRKKRKLGRDRRLRPAKREQLGKWVAWISFFVHGKPRSLENITIAEGGLEGQGPKVGSRASSL